MTFLGFSVLLLTIITLATGIFRPTNSAIGNKTPEYFGWQFYECFLPPHPENGQWEVIGGTGTPGSAIIPNILLKFSCNSGFELEPKIEYFICDRDWDTSKMPRCIEKVCPPLKSSLVKIVRCFDGKGAERDCSIVPNGGSAVTQCAPYYELSKEGDATIQCLNGNWSSSLPECNIVCGEAVKIHELPVSYGNERIPQFPWIAIIYWAYVDRTVPVCTATLISTSHVITAPQCVFIARIHKVSAGKIYSKYGDPRDLMAQYVEVINYVIHPNYDRIFQKTEANIAVMKTKHPLRLSPLVQPICIRGLPEIFLSENDMGTLAGWDPLQSLQNMTFSKEVTVMNEKQCKKKHLERYYVELDSDKVCVHVTKEDFLCRVLIGAVFAVKNTKNNRFFLHGFLSRQPNTIFKKPLCSESSLICTKTLSYYDFILEAMEKL